MNMPKEDMHAAITGHRESGKEKLNQEKIANLLKCGNLRAGEATSSVEEEEAAGLEDMVHAEVSLWDKKVRSQQLSPWSHRDLRGRVKGLEIAHVVELPVACLKPGEGTKPLALGQRTVHVPLQVCPERESREHEEPTTSEMTEETYPPKAYRPKHGRLSDMKAEALKKDRRKKLTLAKFVGMAENTAHPRVVIPELRQEFELGPCRRHMEASLQELKSSQRMVPRAVHLPNCDRKGFYKRKQCKPSRGRKRGLCWCVDKYGMKLPGTDYLSGDLQCHAFDSSNVE
ncbi:hypothetical protein llap_3138 [Limosa lapponica baueri]|uniref:Thyroglobulin type-1 domain-containing protein n=11 Tax=Charadriiformes TaxID=8906 RepID=A0A2I0UKK9_LIMLA|nr:hypothetical protein llap_3138 [Limosa lapponica baueri]